MAKKNSTQYWLLVVILTLALWVFQNVISWINGVLGFMNELYFFTLCLGSAMYLATRFK